MPKTKKTKRVRKTNPVLVAILIVVLAISLGLLWYVQTTPDRVLAPVADPIEIEEPVDLPSHEDAELAGFGFMQDFAKLTTEDDDDELREKMYDALSEDAKERIAMDTFLDDVLEFVGVETVPEQGTSVEDLQITGDETAEFFSGLNYLDGRILRQLNLVVEDGEWKVDSVEEYHKDEEAIVPAVDAVMELVMEETGLEKDALVLVSTMEQQWPDGCLGLPEEDEMCTMAIVPGYEVVLEVEDETRTFRTDMEGSVIREEV